jgi:hypothetical protein
MAMFAEVGSGAVGANVDQLKELGTLIKNKIEQIEQIFTEIDNKINGTAWSGTDAKNFASNWDQYRSSTISNIKDQFEGEAQRAISNAEAQVSTSGS